MGRGGFVETKREPIAESVEDYHKYLKYNAPNKDAEMFTRGEEIECTCCTQKAPSEAAALLAVEDQTPFTKKFEGVNFKHNRTLGETVWICADCYHHGVRPKYVYFGELKWDETGRKVKRRTEELGRPPW